MSGAAGMLLKLALVVLGFYAVILAYVWASQARMLFLPEIPTRELVATPETMGLDFEEVRFSAGDGTGLHAWWIPAQEARGALLFFHGNAGNISHRLDSIALFHALGLGVFIIDYRGYGESGGSPSEPGVYADARAAWRVLTDDMGLDPSRIVLFGRSLGGAVAVELATVVDPAGLIVESSFTTVPDLGAHHYPWLPVRTLSRLEFDSVSRIPEVGTPLLVIHSPDDRIIPFRYGRELFEAAVEPKTFLEISGGHNEGWWQSRERYRAGLEAFLDRVLRDDVQTARTPADPVSPDSPSQSE